MADNVATGTIAEGGNEAGSQSLNSPALLQLVPSDIPFAEQVHLLRLQVKFLQDALLKQRSELSSKVSKPKAQDAQRQLHTNLIEEKSQSLSEENRKRLSIILNIPVESNASPAKQLKRTLDGSIKESILNHNFAKTLKEMVSWEEEFPISTTDDGPAIFCIAMKAFDRFNEIRQFIAGADEERVKLEPRRETAEAMFASAMNECRDALRVYEELPKDKLNAAEKDICEIGTESLRLDDFCEHLRRLASLWWDFKANMMEQLDERPI